MNKKQKAAHARVKAAESNRDAIKAEIEGSKRKSSKKKLAELEAARIEVRNARVGLRRAYGGLG